MFSLKSPDGVIVSPFNFLLKSSRISYLNPSRFVIFLHTSALIFFSVNATSPPPVLCLINPQGIPFITVLLNFLSHITVSLFWINSFNFCGNFLLFYKHLISTLRFSISENLISKSCLEYTNLVISTAPSISLYLCWQWSYFLILIALIFCSCCYCTLSCLPKTILLQYSWYCYRLSMLKEAFNKVELLSISQEDLRIWVCLTNSRGSTCESAR